MLHKLQKRVVALVMAVTVSYTGFAWNGSLLAEAGETDSSGSSDFVSTNGTHFWYQGSEYYYCGSNCYYLNFKSENDIDAVLEGAKDMGVSVIRTWGHLDAGTIQKGQKDSSGYQVFKDSVDGQGQKDGIYYQYFDDERNEPVVNEGADGLRRLDYAIYKAQQNDVKLILTLTNNWSAFGGMDQYVKWAGYNVGQDTHQLFYTDSKIKGWFKNYINTLLNHTNYYTGVKYKDDPAVFSWELANEPRCSADAQCGNNIVYNWASEMSAYIKSIDSNHMVSLGDEGFFNYDRQTDTLPTGADSNSWIWWGSEGMDFEKLIGIGTIDFATPHIYIGDWNMSTTDNAEAWIRQHAAVAHAADKPIILEEFGFNSSKEGRLYSDGAAFYSKMYRLINDCDYAGSNFWMLADIVENNGGETNTPYMNYDGYNVYSCTAEDLAAKGITDSSILKRVTDTAGARAEVVKQVKYVSELGNKNFVNPTAVNVDLANVADISVTLSLQTGASLNAITLNGSVRTLTQDSDYTVGGTAVILKKSFLATLEEGQSILKFLTSTGIQPEMEITVTNSAVTGANVAQDIFTFDKNPKTAQDITIPVTINDAGAFKGVKLRATGSEEKILNKGTDYTYAQTATTATVTLSADYLAALTGTQAVFELDYAQGKDPVITVNIKDTTGQDVIDDFEDYTTGTSSVTAAWARNTNGAWVETSIVTGKTDSKAMKYHYDLSGNTYAGVSKQLGGVDFRSFDGIQFWYQPDGSSNQLTVQIHDKEGVYWEKYITMSGTSAQEIRIPFSEMTVKSGYGTPSGNCGDSKFIDFSIYVDKKTDTLTGDLCFDNIEAYVDGTASEPAAVTGVSLDKTALNLKVGESAVLAAAVAPSNAANRAISWSTSDTSVATVSDGIVTASKEGTADITVTTVDGGKTAVCNVTVTESDTGGGTGEEKTVSIDDFEGYATGTDGVTASWSRNTNGAWVETSVVTGQTESKAMKYYYDLNGNTYAGVSKQLQEADFSSFDGIRFWYQPDGSSNQLTIQIHDRENVCWEKHITMNTTTAQEIRIPFSEMEPKAGYGTPSGNCGDSRFVDFSIYVDKKTNTMTGDLYFDNVAVYALN